MQHERVNPYDVFEVGDEIPWYSSHVTVVGRGVADEVPDCVHENFRPSGFNPIDKSDGYQYAVLKIEPADDLDMDEDIEYVLASEIGSSLQYSFNSHGLPSVSAKARPSIGMGRSVSVQTPATGSSHLDGEGAAQLAEFLRENAEFEPLYTLLGGTGSVEDVEEVAQALELAADVYEYGTRMEL